MDDGGGDSVPRLSLVELKAVSALGRGAKGAVFLIRIPSSPHPLALKAVAKSHATRVNQEQRLLISLSHPLLPKLHGFFQSDKLVGYAMDYCPGPTLRSLRKNQTEQIFSHAVIRFYAAELVLVLEYLHGLGIAYRDLKPDNIMIQENGHIMLVDFDLSKKLQSMPQSTAAVEVKRPEGGGNHGCIPALFGHGHGSSWVSPESETEAEVQRRASGYFCKSKSFVGTEEYMPPEIVLGSGHDIGADWWSLGVVLYEMLHGVTPFRGVNRKETFYRILTAEPKLVGQPTPLRDLIRELLEKQPGKRAGLREIKAHSFFAGVNWEDVLEICRPPYVPPHKWGDDDGGVEETVDMEVFVERMSRGGLGQSDETCSSQSFDF